MNKEYKPLDLKIVVLSLQDVVTASNPDGGGEDFIPGENQLPIVGGGIFG